MDEDYVCVAGIDENNMFIRPEIEYPYPERPGIKREFLFSSTGEEIIRPMTYVEFEFLRSNPKPPYHTEDWIIDGGVEPRIVSHSNDKASTRILKKSFDKCLDKALSAKDRSLVTIRPPFIPKIKIKIDDAKRLCCRLTLKDSDENWINNVEGGRGHPAVTDAYWLALCKHLYNKGKSESEIEKYLRNLIERAERTYIIVGITREWRGNFWRQISGVLTVPYWLGDRTLADFGYDWTDNVNKEDK